MRFAPEAVGIIVPIVILGAVLTLWGLLGRNLVPVMSGAVVIGLAAVLLLFFRDPQRQIPDGEHRVVAPADGRIIVSETLPDGRKHIAIFLSVFNVHVNRTPVAGRVVRIAKTKGAHHHAGSEQADVSNERVDVDAITPYGGVSWRQVAGLLARRISCRLKESDEFTRGVPFGLIYFGSRMDVFLPSAATLTANVGWKVKAGETVIAEFMRKDSE